MAVYDPGIIHNIGLFGHGGSGKTTLTEALLLTAKAISRAGRVEDGNTVSDYDSEEQKRHMSMQLAVASIDWEGEKITLIDTPGYADFAGDVAAAMRVIDGAVIVLDASGGVEVGAEAVWDAAVAMKVPHVIFINKLDRDNADFYRTLEQAQERLDAAVIPMQLPIGQAREFKGIISLRRQRAWLDSGKRDGSYIEADIPADMLDLELEWREKLVDKIAATNDDLIEKYLEGGADALTPEELQRGLRAGIANGSIVPVFCGSATNVVGMAQLLKGLLDSIPSAGRKTVEATELASGTAVTLRPAADQPLSALVFKTIADPYGKLSFVRVFSGELHANSTIFNHRLGKDERIGQLFVVRGKEQTAVQALGPGDIGVATRLTEAFTNDTFALHEKPLQLAPIVFPASAFTGAIKPKTRNDLDKLGTVMTNVLAEDPTLQATRDPQTSEMLLSGLGESHLNIVADKMKNKYGVSVDIELPRVPYRETIRGRAEAQYRHKKQSGGAGQFADVTIRIEPLPVDPSRPDSLDFVNSIVGGVIDRSFIPSVEKGVRAAMSEGVISGNPVVDVRVELFDGKMHPVDSKDIAFQIAGHEAFKIAASKATPVLTEPIFELEITVPDQYAGDIMSDMNSRRGRVLGMINVDGGRTVITAQVPLAEVQRYGTDLRAITQGRGRFVMRYDHYDEVPAHLAQPLIEAQKAEHSHNHNGGNGHH
jgi:elongation factor G